MSIEAMKQMVEALESFIDQLAKPYSTQAQYAITAGRQAIAEAEKHEVSQEPVAWYDSESGWTDFHSFKPARKPSSPSAKWLPLYTHPQPKCEWVASDMEKIYEDAFYQGVHEGLDKAMTFSRTEYFKTKKLQVTLQDRPIDIELAQYKRMFEAACSALGAVSDALGCDPDEGGAEPLLFAIEELKSNTQPKREWVGLTDDEINEGLLRSDYALQTAHAWRAGVVFAMTKLKDKNT